MCLHFCMPTNIIFHMLKSGQTELVLKAKMSVTATLLRQGSNQRGHRALFAIMNDHLHRNSLS